MIDEESKRKLLMRLKRAEGQVAAIRRMVDDEKYCVDILLQLSAAQGALAKVGQLMLAVHIETCVEDAFLHGDAAARKRKVAELLEVLERYAGVGGR